MGLWARTSSSKGDQCSLCGVSSRGNPDSSLRPTDYVASKRTYWPLRQGPALLHLVSSLALACLRTEQQGPRASAVHPLRHLRLRKLLRILHDCFLAGRCPSVAAAYLLIAPAAISMALTLRDFSKAPFFVWSIALLITAIRRKDFGEGLRLPPSRLQLSASVTASAQIA